MSTLDHTPTTEGDVADAFTEVSFLLDIFSATVDELMGGGTVSLGRVAGRHMARRLPVFLEEATLPDAVAAVVEHGGLGADFSCRADLKQFQFQRCTIREVCRQRDIALGGNLCRLYHYYLDGVLNELVLRPVRSTVRETGPTCTLDVELR